MINLLVTKDAAEITDFLHSVFTISHGDINLTEIDIREGVHLVDVSRRIFQRLVEADEFEKNFCSKYSRIPKSYVSGKGYNLTLKEKAEIFALRYVSKSRAVAKGVNQGLKRNNSYKAFGVPLPNVIDSLKTRNLLQVYSLDEVDRDGRPKKKYRVTYNNADIEHAMFLEKFQILYPGEVL